MTGDDDPAPLGGSGKVEPLSEAVFRVHAPDGLPGTRILKVVSCKKAGGDDIGRGNSPSVRALDYWAREPLFYEASARGHFGWTGLSLRPPRVLKIEPRDPGTTWLWLEDVPERAGAWGITEYARVATQLGTFNAFHFQHPAVDTPNWLSRSWLRSWFVATVPAVRDSLAALSPRNRERVNELLDVDRAARLVDVVWSARRRLFDQLKSVPLTLSHLDANRQNLLVTGADETVAVDWAYVGLEGMSADASQLFASSAVRLQLPSGDLAEHYAAILEGYAIGLHRAGIPATGLKELDKWFRLTTLLRWGVGHLLWIRHLNRSSSSVTPQRLWWDQQLDECAGDLARLHSYFRMLMEGEDWRSF